jgi:hypothetical protein
MKLNIMVFAAFCATQRACGMCTAYYADETTKGARFAFQDEDVCLTNDIVESKFSWGFWFGASYSGDR